jgi:hypothetical protein
VIFDVVVVRFERRQPTLVDQAVISAAIDIAGGVFAAAAGNNLADQLEIFILHDAPTLAISLFLSGQGRVAGHDQALQLGPVVI